MFETYFAAAKMRQNESFFTSKQCCGLYEYAHQYSYTAKKYTLNRKYISKTCNLS